MHQAQNRASKKELKGNNINLSQSTNFRMLDLSIRNGAESIKTGQLSKRLRDSNRRRSRKIKKHIRIDHKTLLLSQTLHSINVQVYVTNINKSQDTFLKY